MTRHMLTLTPGVREKAHRWVDAALQAYQPGRAMTLEIREPKRSDAQNAAFWGLLAKITKQRPIHNGRKMTPELWKSVFMDALGHEVDYISSLDGQRIFPLGHRSSHLSKSAFSDLLTLIISWADTQGLTLQHFDIEPDQ